MTDTFKRYRLFKPHNAKTGTRTFRRIHAGAGTHAVCQYLVRMGLWRHSNEAHHNITHVAQAACNRGYITEEQATALCEEHNALRRALWKGYKGNDIGSRPIKESLANLLELHVHELMWDKPDYQISYLLAVELRAILYQNWGRRERIVQALMNKECYIRTEFYIKATSFWTEPSYRIEFDDRHIDALRMVDVPEATTREVRTLRRRLKV